VYLNSFVVARPPYPEQVLTMAEEQNVLSRIAVRGFKSIGNEQAIDIRPLTILAGANSSGKSSLLQPVLLLKQTIEAPGDPGPLLLDGPNVHFSQADQLLNRTPPKGVANEFAVRLETADATSVEVVFCRDKELGLDLASMTWCSSGKTARFTPGMTHEQLLPHALPSWSVLIAKLFEGGTKLGQLSIARDRCFLSVRFGRPDEKVSFPPSGTVIFPPIWGIVDLVKGLIHLPGLRGNPRRSYSKGSSGPQFPGTFEGYAASVVADWQRHDKDRLRQLSKALTTLGLTWKIATKSVDDTQVEIMAGRLARGKQGGAQDLVNIADMGFGVSQALPVAVALIVARPGQAVYLEQPEIHLHPRAQRKMAHLLAEAAKRGVRVIVETHSSLLLREVQTMVAQGALDPAIVKLHWVERSEVDGCTTVTPADLDENGAYGPWPEDFDDVELAAEGAYLDAVEKRQASVAESAAE